MPIKILDQPVITVRDVEATCAFYARALGVVASTADDGRKTLKFGDREFRLQPLPGGAQPEPGQPIPGSARLGFLTPTPLGQVIDHLGRVGIPIADGPDDRIDAEGTFRSIGIRDPDGNLVEVSNRIDD